MCCTREEAVDVVRPGYVLLVPVPVPTFVDSGASSASTLLTPARSVMFSVRM